MGLRGLLRPGSHARRHRAVAARQQGPLHRPVYLLIGAFAITTAVFWANTSHKSALDIVLFVYAAAAITGAPLRRTVRV